MSESLLPSQAMCFHKEIKWLENCDLLLSPVVKPDNFRKMAGSQHLPSAEVSALLGRPDRKINLINQIYFIVQLY